MLNDSLREKTISCLTDAQSIVEHVSGLLYAESSERVSFQITWIKWYLERLSKSVDCLDELEF